MSIIHAVMVGICVAGVYVNPSVVTVGCTALVICLFLISLVEQFKK